MKSPPANAGDMGSIPGLGKRHMLWSNKGCAPQLLSLHFRAQEPRLLKPSRPRACAEQLERRKSPLPEQVERGNRAGEGLQRDRAKRLQTDG